MTKSKLHKNFLKRLTPERKEELRLRALDIRSKWTLAYQLGHYVGEMIVVKHLPTISVDAIHTRKNISVTAAEGDESCRLNDVWFNKRMESRDDDAHSEAEWKALRAHHEMLEDKYLPKTVECHFQLLNVTDEHMEEFKNGVRAALWDCDACHYNISKNEDIDVIADTEGWFTVIALKR